MSYKAYTHVHYILNRKDEENNKTDHYYLINKQGGDVHRVESHCIREPSVGKVPCNLMSGDYHGLKSDDYWFRVDAPVARGCEAILLDCSGKYEEEPAEYGFEVDGSLYTNEYGVTVGKDSAPSSNEHFYINDYGTDIKIPNKVLGRPVNLPNDPKYPSYDILTQEADKYSREFSINNGGELIDSNGTLKANIYVTKGKLLLDWDKWAMTTDVVSADEPCSPKRSDKDKTTWDHECNICNARADWAKSTIYDQVNSCIDCYDRTLAVPYYGTYETPAPCAGEEGLPREEWTCYDSTVYLVSESPCGEEWDDNPDGELENCLSKIHTDGNFTSSKSLSAATDRYRTMCFDDCNEGTNTFGEGHPNSASCRDGNYISDGGRLSDIDHSCGTHPQGHSVKTPLNKPLV